MLGRSIRTCSRSALLRSTTPRPLSIRAMATPEDHSELLGASCKSLGACSRSTDALRRVGANVPLCQCPEFLKSWILQPTSFPSMQQHLDKDGISRTPIARRETPLVPKDKVQDFLSKMPNWKLQDDAKAITRAFCTKVGSPVWGEFPPSLGFCHCHVPSASLNQINHPVGLCVCHEVPERLR